MNKKIAKFVAGIVIASALCTAGFSLSACSWSTQTVEGEYHYTNYGVEYGVKVNVEIQTDSKGDRIRKVTIVESDYTQLSSANPDYGWTDEMRQVYIDGEQELLNAYRGLYVADVMAMEVTTASTGEPSAVSDSSVIISGATQSAGRLLLAIQDACSNFGYSVSEGEYSYANPWDASSRYGIAVKVVLKGDVIQKVSVIDSSYIEVSDSWTDKALWNDGLEELLNSYVGKTVDEVLAVTVTISDSGQPESVSDSSYVITGATQGSGRLLLAVQNALGSSLSNGDGVNAVTYEGEYSYENAWVAGSYYGIKVSVSVDDNTDTIISVSVLDSDYIEVSDSWTDKALWEDGLEELLNSYAGKSVAEVLAVTVTTSDSVPGQPEEVSDSSYVITGATQGSGRLLLAVQNALENGGYTLCEGEYSYENAWVAGSYYGIKVSVLVKNDTIVSVSVVDSDYIEVSDSWADKALWEDGLEELLDSYVGKTVDEVLAVTVTTSDSVPGQPEEVSDSSYVITGATQGSGRLLLAVQNALENGGYTLCEGEYSYENAWVAGSYYGIKVSVLVKNDTIVSVSVVDSDYIEVSDSWADKALWEDGLEELLNSYVGKTVDEVLAVTVTTSDSVPGQPEEVSDSSYVLTGATQGSGRLLLAVQNALESL